MGDPDVAVGFAAGDPNAVRAVYQTYSRLVYSVAYNVLGDRGLAEDATQQTFLQAWRSASTYDPIRELGPWLVTIARRAAIDVYRRDRRHQNVDGLDSADPALISLPPSAEQIYDVWEVRRALDTLSAEDQELICLQHYREFTHTEIAQHLAIPIGTVKSRTFRAHRRLAGLLGYLRGEPDHTVADADASNQNSREGGATDE